MKTIEWLGPEKMIPNFGVVNAGDQKELPDNVADSFVEQGLGKFINETKKQTKIKEGAE